MQFLDDENWDDDEGDVNYDADTCIDIPKDRLFDATAGDSIVPEFGYWVTREESDDERLETGGEVDPHHHLTGCAYAFVDCDADVL